MRDLEHSHDQYEGIAGSKDHAYLHSGTRSFPPLPHVLNLHLNDDDALLQGVSALDEAVAFLDPPHQAANLDLHDRATSRAGHEHPSRMGNPVTSAAAPILCAPPPWGLTGEEMELTSIHAGLECATFAVLNPALDVIATKFQIDDAHTVDEALHLNSIVPFVLPHTRNNTCKSRRKAGLDTRGIPDATDATRCARAFRGS